MRFLHEIKNEALREKIVVFYQDKLDLLSLRPGSISGEHHPGDEDRGGGQIIHSDKVAWFCMHMCEQMQYPDNIRDVLIAAAYLHDVSKSTIMGYKRVIFNFEGAIARGHQLKPGDTDKHHANFSAREGAALIKGTVPHEDLVVFYNVVERHMAHWYPEDDDRKPPMPETDIEKMFALADYIVSREGLLFDWSA